MLATKMDGMPPAEMFEGKRRDGDGFGLQFSESLERARSARPPSTG